MQFGSICSGIEAASVAWSGLGWNASWLAEVDVAAAAVLAHRLGATAPVYPLAGTEKQIKKIAWRDQITNWGDMTKLPAAVREGRASAPDILCGGTPCQGFSIAGLRKGLEDPRGRLTLSFIQLANAIDDVREARGDQPSVIFWENVPGVRSDQGNAFGHFIAGLVGVEDPIEPGPRPEHGRSSAFWTWKKETCQHIPKWPSAGVASGPRRTVAWRTCDAQFFDLAQRRERVFVVGSAREGFDPQEVLLEFDGVRRDSPPSRHAGQELAGTFAASTYRGGISGKDEAGLGYVQPVGPRSVDLDAFRMVAFGEYAHDGSASTLKARDYKDATDLVVSVALRGREGGGTAELGDDAAGTLRASSGGGDKPHILCFDTTQVTSPKNFSNPKPGDPCHPLAAGAHPPAICVHGTQDPITSTELAHALGRNSGQENDVWEHQMTVRRLMPVECERLQGFPDGWTDVPIGNGAVADGPRYKQLGNSWAVACVSWIGRRIAAHLAELDAPAEPVGDPWIAAP